MYNIEKLFVIILIMKYLVDQDVIELSSLYIYIYICFIIRDNALYLCFVYVCIYIERERQRRDDKNRF